MDYSAVAGDEHAGGTSPWATSPQQSRFPPSDSQHTDIPSSPLPPGAQYSAESGDSRPTTADSEAVERFPGKAPVGENGESEGRQQQQEGESDVPTGAGAGAGGPATQARNPPMVGQQRYKAQGREKRPQPQYKLTAKVTGLERNGRKDPVLRFDVYVCDTLLIPHTIAGYDANSMCQTNLPKFRTTQFRDVRRTHTEFIKLQEHLISANPECLVPAVPPSVTAAGAGTEEDETRVKNNMQRWLSIVCSNDVLMKDEEMIFFVESDFGYSPVVRLKQPATGMRRKMIKQFAPPPDDTPELAEARPVVKMFYLESMGAGQKVDKVVKARRCMFIHPCHNHDYEIYGTNNV